MGVVRLATALVMALAVLIGTSGADTNAAQVRGYYRKNGTYVRPHIRSAPDGIKSNNYGPSRNRPSAYTNAPAVIPPAVATLSQPRPLTNANPRVSPSDDNQTFCRKIFTDDVDGLASCFRRLGLDATTIPTATVAPPPRTSEDSETFCRKIWNNNPSRLASCLGSLGMAGYAAPAIPDGEALQVSEDSQTFCRKIWNTNAKGLESCLTDLGVGR
jgi:hypothetical protein